MTSALPPELVLDAGDVRATVATASGGRVASFVVQGRELLVTEGYGPIQWGSYPMAPYAGRVREGRFSFDGRDHQLAINLAPHAIHGVVFDRPWEPVDERTITIELGSGWPFRGRVVQRFDLGPDRFDVSLELHADEPMPATMGWHPWFRRELPRVEGTAVPPPSGSLELEFHAGAMFERGPDGIPTGELIAPKPRPWDDCFTGVRPDPRLTWPGQLELEIGASCAYWVVYDETDYAICVEPQTGPPNALNIDPVLVTPGRPLVATMNWRWRPLGT